MLDLARSAIAGAGDLIRGPWTIVRLPSTGGLLVLSGVVAKRPRRDREAVTPR